MKRGMEMRTERLLLRAWRFSDVDDAYANASDPEWARYLWTVRQPYTYRDAEEFIAACVLNPWQEDAQFAIELDGRAVGGVRLRITEPGIASLGYNVARGHWGKGIATEATSAVVGLAFESLEMVKVFAAADARNTASIRVMEKLGMRREGVLRRQRYFRGEYADEVRYGILAEEYQDAGRTRR